jgi:hypothetical protein
MQPCTKDDEDPGVNCTFKSQALCNYTTEVGTGLIGWQYKSHVTSGQNLPIMDATGNTNGKLFFFNPMYCLSFFIHYKTDITILEGLNLCRIVSVQQVSEYLCMNNGC